MVFTKTPAIIVATHGRLCEELVSTAAMIVGSLDDVIALPLLAEEDVTGYLGRLEELIDAHAGDAVVLLDLVGGSPFNAVMRLCRDKQLCAVAGVNLPMLIEALSQRGRQRDPGVLSERITDAAKAAIRDLTPVLLKGYSSGATK